MAHRASLVPPHQQYALEDIGKKTVALSPRGPGRGVVIWLTHWNSGCYGQISDAVPGTFG
jgi:hypothetical protein